MRYRCPDQRDVIGSRVSFRQIETERERAGNEKSKRDAGDAGFPSEAIEQLSEHCAADEATEEIAGEIDAARRAAIGGCAGSGKSLLAIAKAQDLARSGKRVLLTCFNRALAEHWQDALQLSPNVAVRHFHGFCRDRVVAAGVKAPKAEVLRLPLHDS